MIEITPQNSNIDEFALKVFMKTIEIIQPRKLIQLRYLTWLPSLITASFVVVLHYENQKTSEQIAKELGIATSTVKNILQADENLVKEKLEENLNEKDETKRTHVAGALAKLAYHELKMTQ